MKKQTYKINDLIELRLENNQTNIYVKGKQFNQCKYLLLNIPTKLETYERDYISIDELEKVYSNKNETDKEIEWLTPEIEFFGHCSNIQAWYENNYNPHMLHSNLSVPLLKELIKYDVRVLYALLYYLDSYWIDYEKEYDSNFTSQRRELLINQYKDIILEAIIKYNLNEYDLLSVFLINCKLVNVLPNLFPFAMEYCEMCDSYILKGKMEFYDITIYNDSYDNTNTKSYHICVNCDDHLYDDGSYESCSYCGRIFSNYNGENVIYSDMSGDLMCIKCFNEGLMDEGLSDFYLLDYIDNSVKYKLIENGWKYIISKKLYSESDWKEFESDYEYLRNDLNLKVFILLEHESYSDYRRNIKEYAIFIKK